MAKRITQRFAAVIVRHPFGFPIAYPVVLMRSGGRNTSAKIVLDVEDRNALHRAAIQAGTCKDGLDWCAGLSQVRNRSDEGGEEIALEPPPIRNSYYNGEVLAVEVSSIEGRLPKEPFRGEGGNTQPIDGLNWHQAYLTEAVQKAGALVGQR